VLTINEERRSGGADCRCSKINLRPAIEICPINMRFISMVYDRSQTLDRGDTVKTRCGGKATFARHLPQERQKAFDPSESYMK
jgi:hypothetical protein